MFTVTAVTDTRLTVWEECDTFAMAVARLVSLPAGSIGQVRDASGVILHYRQA